MEEDGANPVLRLRHLFTLAAKPGLDEGFRMLVQQRITSDLHNTGLPLLEGLAFHEEDENLRRAAGLIYAWKLAASFAVPRGAKVQKLNALISAEGAFPEVIGYVKGSLPNLLGWPVGAWNTMMDEGKPEEERVISSREVICYCRQNEYADVLHRIARDEKVPMEAREAAMCALIEVQLGWQDGNGVNMRAMARSFIDNGCGPSPQVDHRLACSEFIRNTEMKRNICVSWDRAKMPVPLKKEELERVRAKLFKLC